MRRRDRRAAHLLLQKDAVMSEHCAVVAAVTLARAVVAGAGVGVRVVCSGRRSCGCSGDAFWTGMGSAGVFVAVVRVARSVWL